MHQIVQHTLLGLSVSSMSSTLVVQSRTPNPGHIEMAGQDCNPAHTIYVRTYTHMIWRLKLFWCMYTRSTEKCSVISNLIVNSLGLTATGMHHNVIAEQRERSEANNRVLFEIPRYLYIYIYIYMSVCKCIVQDRAHLTQVLSRRPLRIWHTGCCSAHHFEESPLH